MDRETNPSNQDVTLVATVAVWHRPFSVEAFANLWRDKGKCEDSSTTPRVINEAIVKPPNRASKLS